MFCNKGVLRNFKNLFFNKVTGLQLSLKRFRHQVFSYEFCEISKNIFFHRKPFFIEHLWWLFLNLATSWYLFIKIEIEILLRFSKITIKCCRLKDPFVLHFFVFPYFKNFFTLTVCKIFLPLCNFWFLNPLLFIFTF